MRTRKTQSWIWTGLLAAPLLVLPCPQVMAATHTAHLTPHVGTGHTLEGFAAPRARHNKTPPPMPAPDLKNDPQHPGMGTPPPHRHRPQSGRGASQS